MDAKNETLASLLGNHSVVELALGILAVCACEAVGRTYIVENPYCIDMLVDIMTKQSLDSSLHIQALAALQRLSLRRRPQDRMIELGLIEWVINEVLMRTNQSEEEPSEFSLEFGSALLMNLALRSAGKHKCMELDTLTMALSLMEHPNPQIRTHVNGTLYSLLSMASFRERAKRIGLDNILRSILGQASHMGDEIFEKQIEYLIDQLNPPDGATSDDVSDNEDEEDDENFLEEEELAGLLLGDRSSQEADEALRDFTPTS